MPFELADVLGQQLGKTGATGGIGKVFETLLFESTDDHAAEELTLQYGRDRPRPVFGREQNCVGQTVECHDAGTEAGIVAAGDEQLADGRDGARTGSEPEDTIEPGGLAGHQGFTVSADKLVGFAGSSRPEKNRDLGIGGSGLGAGA